MRTSGIMCSEVDIMQPHLCTLVTIHGGSNGYDEALAHVSAQPCPLSGLTEKKMFGGIAFMVDGNMACGSLRIILWYG